MYYSLLRLFQPSMTNNKDKPTHINLRPLHNVPKALLWIILIVVTIFYCYLFYQDFVLPYSYRWKAIYGDVKYPPGEVRGIDVSHYQKHIDWDKLSKSQIQDNKIGFMFIKATEGKDGIDSNYFINYEFARNHNIPVGAYHFFTTQSTGIEQARHFCQTTSVNEGDLPPVLDVEVDYEENYDSLKHEILNWLSFVENHYRVRPIIYASYRLKTDFLNDSIFNQYPYWIAHYYVDSLQYEGSWTFWQHTDAGHVDGIDGYVDIDVFNGSKEKFNQLLIKKHVETNDNDSLNIKETL